LAGAFAGTLSLAPGWGANADDRPVGPGDRASQARCLCAIQGSLYERQAIARELGLAEGRDDASFIASAYGRLGPAVLGRLRGDFALAVWDEAAGRGLLACDQLGSSALFLHARGGELLFASELRELLPLLAQRPGPDRVAVVHWLSLGGPPPGRTFYEGVEQLAAGHYVELDGAGWRIARYWQPRYRAPERVDREEAAALVRAGLERAVLRRSVGGERTGVMLSGGIDSAAVAGIASAGERRPIGAYSAVFPRHPQIDESRLIALLCAQLGLTSFALPVLGGSVLSGALGYIRDWEVPATSPNLFFWSEILHRAAEDGVTTMLDGEGGDTLFWLSPYLLADRLTSGRLWSAVSLARRFPSDAGRVQAAVAARLIRDWGLKGAMPYRVHRRRQRLRGEAALAPSWLTEASAKLRFETDPELGWKRLDGPRWWASLLDAVTGVSSTLVHDAARRRNASAGLRAGHPLLDVDLIELVLSLPPEHAFDRRLSRPLLRDGVRGLVPEEVRLRPSKSSFDTLFHELLADRELASVRSLLLADDAEVNAFVDRDRVRAELFADAPPRAPGALQAWALQAWRLATAEMWLRHQAGRTPAS
jgi:asparagine synthase (glutamine-hydrolysing)